MKPNFSHLIGFTFLLMTLVFFSASAQEGVPNNEIPDFNPHPESTLHDEKPLLFEPERSTSNNNEKATQGKEQLISSPKSGKTKTGDAPKSLGAKTEDDALSFNFLYYIIQKFKISDIVEQ